MKRIYKALLCLIILNIYSLARCQDNPGEIKILIESQKALYGTTPKYKVSGLSPGEKIIIQTSSTDAKGILWKAKAVFHADNSGEVDPDNSAPVEGNYKVVDNLGLFWSMEPSGTENKELNYSYDRDRSLFVTITVTDSKGKTVKANLERYYEDPQRRLTSCTLDEEGLKGTLFSPSDSNKYPGIILLTGSGGGDIKWLAKAIASRGFSVLTLPYFNYIGLPDDLVNIPVEYFEKAVGWLKNHRKVKNGNIGLIGGSRGGELALLLGSMFNEFNVIVAWSPSSHLWMGENYFELVPAWTYDGKALPYLGNTFNEEEMNMFMTGQMTSFVDYFRKTLNNSDPGLVERARIKVENIKCNLFLVAATDDDTWPSSDYAKIILDHYKKTGYEYQFICAEGAGHMVFLPDLIPGKNRVFNGGSPDNDLKYGLVSWRKMIDFLHISFY